MNILLNNNLPTDSHSEFGIIKLLIEKGNLNLMHNKDSYHLSRKIFKKNYIMRCNSWTIKSDLPYQHYIY